MKRLIIVLWLSSFSLAGLAEDRVIFQGNEESIEVSDRDGVISIIRSNKLNDVILLVKGVDIQKLSKKQMHNDAIQFFYNFLTTHKLHKLDRPKLGYGLLKDGYGFIGGNLYTIKISDLMRLNNRDFGVNDMTNKDNGIEIIPVREVLRKLSVINANELQVDDRETQELRDAVSKFRFRAGLIEGYIEADHSQSDKIKSGAFKFFPNIPKDKGSFYYYGASCKEGGSAFVNVEKDSPNVFCWGGNYSGCEAGIGVEAAMRKGCGSN